MDSLSVYRLCGSCTLMGPLPARETLAKALYSGRLWFFMASALCVGCTLALPTIDLPDDELAAAIAAIRGVIAVDRYPHAPRLDPLRAALARLEAASKPAPKSSPPAKVDKRTRR